MNHKLRIYLDYAASTPVDPQVFAAMKPYLSEKFGNPGSVHSFGQEVMEAVDSSRETIAKAIGAEFREIIFTGSATEANNLALRGAVQGAMHFVPRVIVSAVEHESILETVRELEKEGVEVIYLPVDKNGVIDVQVLEASLNERTVLVSVMYANNEIGTIQPIARISKIIRNFRETRDKRQAARKETSPCLIPHISCRFPLFHTDAVQAFQFLDCDVNLPSGGLGVDMMTLSAHKMYGPKGVGALYVSDKRQATSDNRKTKPTPHFTFPVSPILTGGGQEFGMRSGTENVPSIVGFAKAVELRSYSLIRANERISELRDYLWRGIKGMYPKAEWNGAAIRGGGPAIIPSVLNVYFPGHEAQDILTRFDLRGIAVSSGSACRSRALEASYTIMALGHSKERAKASIRFSLGRPTTKKEIIRVLMALRKIL